MSTLSRNLAWSRSILRRLLIFDGMACSILSRLLILEGMACSILSRLLTLEGILFLLFVAFPPAGEGSVFLFLLFRLDLRLDTTALLL